MITSTQAHGRGGFQGGHDGASEIDLPLELLCGLFTPITVTSVVQCTGNRAKDSIVAHPTEPNGFVGTPLENIEAGMLGNAQWTGPRLADILTALFPTVVRGSNLERWHVEFEGIDGYSASVPLARVLARENDCILATHMNGEPIPRDHGSPVRALLPGVVGARNVKWVCRVRLLDHESTSPWNAKYYKVGASGTVKASAEQLVMQALVLSPAAAAPCPPDGELLDVSGVAYSGGSGNRIVSVQARIGDGDTWVSAHSAIAVSYFLDIDPAHKRARWTPSCTKTKCRGTTRAGDMGGCGGRRPCPSHRVPAPRFRVGQWTSTARALLQSVASEGATSTTATTQFFSSRRQTQVQPRDLAGHALCRVHQSG